MIILVGSWSKADDVTLATGIPMSGRLHLA
jgi:hypothetical protein